MPQHYARRDTTVFKGYRIFFCTMAGAGFFAAAGFSAFAAKPNTIPSLREWIDGTGMVVLRVAVGRETTVRRCAVIGKEPARPR